MKSFIRIILCFSLINLMLNTSAQELVSLKQTDLQCVKNKIKNDDKQLTYALQELIRHADSIRRIKQMPRVTEKKITKYSSDIHDYVSMATYYWPNPKSNNGLPYVPIDGKANPETGDYNDYRNLIQVSQRIQILGLAFFFTGDEKYVKSAMPLINVFFLREDTKMNPNLNHAQFIKGVNSGRIEGIIESRFFIDLLDGIQLMKGSTSFNKQYYSGLQNWFAQYLDWMEKSDRGLQGRNLKNNIETSYHLQRIAFATFLNNRSKVNDIYKTDLAKLINRQFSSNGEQILELRRAKPANYSISNLKYWTDIINVLENNNIEVLSITAKDARISKGLNYLKRFESSSLDKTHMLQYNALMKRRGIRNSASAVNSLMNNLTLDEIIVLLTVC